MSALTSSGVGTCGPDDNQAQAGHLIATHTHTFQKVIRSGERDVNGDLPPEVWAEREVAATLNLHDLGSDTRSVELVVQPLAIRGRADGAEVECGPDGGPSNALRTNGGGSSHALVAITGPVTHALTAEGHDASEDGTGRGTPIIAATLTSGGHPNSNAPGRRREDDENLVGTETTVRRLTPTECERLQGFPDGWTETSSGKPQTDSPRYKQMGNAVAVPVFEWVARRIVAFEDGAL